MVASVQEQAVIDFYRYPAIGVEDWRYGFSTAKVRVLESMLLTRGTLADMASASSFEVALELLGGSDYAAAATAENFGEIEAMLLDKRNAARVEFGELMLDEE